MKGQPSISPIYALGDQQEASCPDRAFARMWRLMSDLWRKRGIIAVYPSELPQELREAVEAWANETYGRRK